MSDAHGSRSWSTARPASRRLAVLAAAVFALCVSGGVARAAWVVGTTPAGPAGPVTSWAVPPTETTCTDTDGEEFETATVAWPETSTPRALDYAATVDGEPLVTTVDGDTRAVVIDQAVLEELFGGPVSGILTVEVTASLPGTAWGAPAVTQAIESVPAEDPPGLTLECTP